MSQHPFHFLSRGFTYPETASFLGTDKPLRLLAGDLGIDVPEQLVPDSLTDMQAEYVRLFINAMGGVGAPPYASVYINHAGILCQQGYDEALSFYSEAGLEPVGNGESPDHIAHELAFVGLLLDQGQDELAERFLEKHLGRWYPAFLEKLLNAEPDPFYRALGQVTDLCLKHAKKEVVHE